MNRALGRPPYAFPCRHGATRVAQFIDRLKRPGGAEALQLTFAKATRGMGVELTIVTTKENDAAMSRELEMSGARLVSFPAGKLVDPTRLANLVRFVRRERFEVIHTHLTGATILGALVGRVCGVPVVTTLHNTEMASHKYSYQGRLESWMLRHAVAEVIAVGARTAAAHEGRLGRKAITVIPNAVAAGTALTPDERHAVRVEMVGRPDGCVLISAGRLTEQKDLSTLLKAFSILRRARDDLWLVVAGGGPGAAELKSQIDTLGLTRAVRFLGLRTDVPRLFAASDIYVNAARWEGLPVAMLEAMSASLAVVATAVGDVPMVLAGGAGVLVPAENAEALASALAHVAQNADLRRSLGDVGRSRVQAEYGAEAWAQKLCQVYERLARPRKLALASKHASAS